MLAIHSQKRTGYIEKILTIPGLGLEILILHIQDCPKELHKMDRWHEIHWKRVESKLQPNICNERRIFFFFKSLMSHLKRKKKNLKISKIFQAKFIQRKE